MHRLHNGVPTGLRLVPVHPGVVFDEDRGIPTSASEVNMPRVLLFAQAFLALVAFASVLPNQNPVA